MEQKKVYLYGMIVKTNGFLLRDGFPERDAYAEIQKKYVFPGGETGTCATVLAGLGCPVKMDGPHMGKRTFPTIREYYQDKPVDLSSLTEDADFDGLEDYVWIDSQARTCLGTFSAYFSDPYKRWNPPKKADIAEADAVGLDPFFGKDSEAAADYCRMLGKPYVTIDCPYDGLMNHLCSIVVLSNEYLTQTYGGCDRRGLLERYMDHTEGLVIFTHGSGKILYGRKGKIFSRPAFSVHAVSTLGAGDTFKAGCVYALLHGMNDKDTVRFAAATAAVACTAFPIPLNPPSLDSIEDLILGETAIG